MISKAEWQQLTDDEKYDFTIYMQGQLEGLIKALSISIPRNKPVADIETKAKAVEVLTLEEWLQSKPSKETLNNDSN